MYILLITVSWQTLAFMLAVMGLFGFIGGVIFMTYDYRIQNKYADKEESPVVDIDQWLILDQTYEWENGIKETHVN